MTEAHPLLSVTVPLDGSWWTLRQDWKLTNLHQDPEFIAMMNELETDIEPTRNPVTGEPHFISIHPHDGFEFREAEMANALFGPGTNWSKSTANVLLRLPM